MPDRKFEALSICLVSVDDSNKLWLRRMADIENGEVVLPQFDELAPRYFENRDKFWHTDGPPNEYFAGVWRWTAEPHYSNSDSDHVKSWFQAEYLPVRVVLVPNVFSDEQLISCLTEGFGTLHHYCDTLFVYSTQNNTYRGAFCKGNQLSRYDKWSTRLNANVYALPFYNISNDDILYIKKKFWVLKSLEIGEPESFVTFGNVEEAIRSIVIERITRSLFKECIGGTKQDWRNCKTVLEWLSQESLIETIQKKLNCSEGAAQSYLQQFLNHVNSLVEKGDIDADILAQIVMRHDGLRQQCIQILEETWRKDHALDIVNAEGELEEIRAKAKNQIEDAQFRLNDLDRKRVAAETDRAALVQEIEKAEEKLSGMQAEIARYEALGNETLEEVRAKIASAQTDMASFIADISVFLPQAQHSLPATCPDISNYTAGSPLPGDDIDISESWEDEVSSLIGNLRAEFSVDLDLCGMLAAFLYSAHINNIPLLIAGPCGKEIADVLSASTLGRTADCLAICKDCRNDIVTGDDAPGILVVKNMFHEGWIDTLPQDFARSKKHVLWTHPYAEDLAIEPKGLYNYALPLFSECFVETVSLHDCIPAKRTENFNAYKSADIQPLRLRAINRLGLSRFLLNRLSRILTDAKIIFGKSNCEQDIELLFGLLPLAVLLGRNDLLQEVLENEKTISGAVRAEVKRYIKEE